MNATATSPPTRPAEVPLTRAEKEKLLQQMYYKEHWIELIRLFGYQTLPMEKARQAIKPLAEKFGKELVATACEILVEISTPDKEPVARLKPHIRRMAFQMLGPEPAADAAPTTVAEAKATPPATEEKAPPRTQTRKPRKQAKESPRPPAEANAAVVATPGCAIMEQYRIAKEKHPGMMLLFRMGDFYELFGEDAETAHKSTSYSVSRSPRGIERSRWPAFRTISSKPTCTSCSARDSGSQSASRSRNRWPVVRFGEG